jgi:tRNA(fMet)-specific endonuclease VapC
VIHLLDTNACIQLLNGTSAGLAERVAAHNPAEIALCAIVKAELLHGARRSRRVAENLDLLRRFFSPLASLPFDDRAAEHYGLIRAELESQGRPIGANDLAIAAIARSQDVTLITHNTREFSRVIGLRVEDWEA